MPVNEKADPSRNVLFCSPSPSTPSCPGACGRLCGNGHNLGCQSFRVMPHQMLPNVHARPLRTHIGVQCRGIRPGYQVGAVERHVGSRQILHHRV